MTTDAPPLARATHPGPQDTGSGLAARVHEHSRIVIAAELRRLARRVPSLGPGELEVIEGALEELTESLVLARLRHAPREAAPVLAHLFSVREES